MRKNIAISLFLIFSLPELNSQEIAVTARFDSTRIYIGDQIYFTVEVEKPAGYLLTIPQFADSIRSGIEILGGPFSDTALLANGKTRIRHKYLVTSFDSGRYEVRPVYAEMTSGKSLKRFFSDYSYLEVMRVKITPPDTASQFFDIVGPYRAPLTAGEVLPWLLAAILAAALIWFILRIIRKLKKEKQPEAEVVNPDPAHLIAFRELENLKNQELWQKGEIKIYHSRLADILRQYIENRYRIPALELTTYETMLNLSRTGIREDDNFRNLKMILSGADLVKFAKYLPQQSENELFFDKAWEFVDATKQAEETVESEPAAGDKEVKS